MCEHSEIGSWRVSSFEQIFGQFGIFELKTKFKLKFEIRV